MGSAVRRCLALVVLLTGCDTHLTTLHAMADTLDADEVSASWFATLVVRDGDIYGAGQSQFGELGVVADVVDTFRLVDGRGTWVTVQAGVHHACALDDVGDVYCWGDGGQGQLGVGDRDGRSAPTRVALPGRVARLVSRDEIGCVILEDDTLWCWGFNDENALAQPDLDQDVLSPARVVVDGDAIADVGVGQGHTCAITVAGRLYCSGRNSEGQLGTHEGEIQTQTHVQVGSFSDWTAVVCSHSTTCGLRGAGELWCWGDNMSGQLGTGDEVVHGTPVRLGSALWRSVDVNAFTICAVGDTGVMSCSGRNQEGELGIAGDGANVYALAEVRSGVRTVATGRFHTCVIADDGLLACTGEGLRGQLGLGDRNGRTVFTDVPRPF